MMTLSSKLKRILAVLLCTMVMLVMAVATLPYFMIPGSETLQRVDGLLHLSVGTRSKADDYVLQLFQQGYSEQIVCLSSQISHDLFPSDYTRINLINRGIPPERISSIHLPIYECPVEVVDFLARYCLDRQWDSVLVVTSPEGNSRGRRLMREDFKKRGISLYFSHAPEDELELRREWWRTHWKIQRLIGAVSDLLLDIYFGDCRPVV
jgi:hypothetical protein